MWVLTTKRTAESLNLAESHPDEYEIYQDFERPRDDRTGRAMKPFKYGDHAHEPLIKFVEFRTTRLADFILNKTNRVLNIDDISPQFVSNESNDLSDYRIVAQYPAGRYFQRWFTQSVHHAEDPRKNQ